MALLVGVAGGVIAEVSVPDLDFGPGLALRDTTRRDRKILRKPFERCVIRPDEFGGAHVDVGFIEGFYVEAVRGRTLQPKPIAFVSKILIGKYIGIDGIR